MYSSDISSNISGSSSCASEGSQLFSSCSAAFASCSSWAWSADPCATRSTKGTKGRPWAPASVGTVESAEVRPQQPQLQLPPSPLDSTEQRFDDKIWPKFWGNHCQTYILHIAMSLEKYATRSPTYFQSLASNDFVHRALRVELSIVEPFRGEEKQDLNRSLNPETKDVVEKS